jgi:toxin ParE1/3/4
MAYSVNLTERVLRELDIYATIHADESAGAARWFSRLEDTISLLSASPRMGKVTREDKFVHEIIYGNKPHFYRILYEIDDTAKRVDILSIWHGKRLPSIDPTPGASDTTSPS